MQRTTIRASAWGADLPIDDDDARNRLLQAAEECYVEHGPSRTTMSHIATKAGVHRTTVYSYFPNREAVRAACFVRAVAAVVDAGEEWFRAKGPFVDRVINAALAGLDAVRRSQAMRSMITADELGPTHRAAEASEIWNTEVVRRFSERFAVAAAAGEVRSDVSPEALAHWVTRVCFSLIDEPGRPEFGGDAGLLRAFLPGALAPLPEPV
jgi:AcrR family transcriptional regulator